MSSASGSSAESDAPQSPHPAPRISTAPDDEPVIPDRARDDSDVGWGDDRDDSARRDDDWYQRERPPHWE